MFVPLQKFNNVELTMKLHKSLFQKTWNAKNLSFFSPDMTSTVYSCNSPKPVNERIKPVSHYQEELESEKIRDICVYFVCTPSEKM